MQIVDLPVEKREKPGSASSRRYCRQGKIPCVLYGRGQENVLLATTRDAFQAVQKVHTAIVRLRLGDAEQTALIRDISWNRFGEYVQHIDFVRVEMEDEVKVKIPMTFLGIPEGVSHGGHVQVLNADLELFCRVDSIPTEVSADISHLNVGDGLHVGEVTYPPNTRPARPADALLVHVQAPRKSMEVGAEGAAAPAGAEAEVPATPAAEE